MRKDALVILAYVLIVAAVVISVKVVKITSGNSSAKAEALLADCSDQTPPANSGE